MFYSDQTFFLLHITFHSNRVLQACPNTHTHTHAHSQYPTRYKRIAFSFSSRIETSHALVSSIKCIVLLCTTVDCSGFTCNKLQRFQTASRWSLSDDKPRIAKLEEGDWGVEGVKRVLNFAICVNYNFKQRQCKTAVSLYALFMRTFPFYRPYPRQNMHEVGRGFGTFVIENTRSLARNVERQLKLSAEIWIFILRSDLAFRLVRRAVNICR